MTSAHASRALVLGGGGPVGIAWESGLAVGLAGAGVHLGGADAIIGTSAGSVVGVHLALGTDLTTAIDEVGEPLPLAPGAGSGIEALQAAVAAAAGASPEAGRAGIGKLALAADTVDEATFTAIGAFSGLAGIAWPSAFRCTAVDVLTGEFRVWDEAAGVPLSSAVASSCSVPGMFPPITIGGNRYMDGGMRTALNADLAVGHSAVIAVSCFALALPAGVSNPMFDQLSAQIEAELTAVRDSGAALEVVVPGAEFLDVSGWGAFLMDPSRAPAAYAAGVRQGQAEAARLGAIWTT